MPIIEISGVIGDEKVTRTYVFGDDVSTEAAQAEADLLFDDEVAAAATAATPASPDVVLDRDPDWTAPDKEA